MNALKQKLDELASRAARAYLDSEIPLNNSIVKLAQEYDLNTEEARRLVETTNRKVFIQKYAAAPPDNKVINFEMADPKVVLSSLEKLGCNEVKKVVANQSGKKSQDKKVDLRSLRQKIESSSVERQLSKTASFDFDNYEPKYKPERDSSELQNISAEYLQKVAEEENARKFHTHAIRKFSKAYQDFTKEAVETLKDYPIDGVIQVLAQVDPSGLNYLDEAFEIAKSQGLVKRARLSGHIVINGNHPLLIKYAKLMQAKGVIAAAKRRMESVARARQALKKLWSTKYFARHWGSK